MSDLARRDQSQAMERMTGEQLKYIANTDYIPKSLKGNLPAIIACVSTGRELGLGDLESLRSIYIVDGRPTFSADLMARQVRKRGHSISGDFTDEQATAVGKRKDNGDTMTVTWTMDMAKRAGLAGKQNWKNYPEAMLWARAVSQLCRMLFGDCLSGVVYTREELEDAVDEFGGPLDNLPPVDPAAFAEVEPQPELEAAPGPEPEDAETGEVVPEVGGQSEFAHMAEQAQAKKAGRHE